MFEFIDKALGIIIVTPHKSAKRVIARRKNNHIQLTVPFRFSKQQVASVLEEMRPRLLRLKPPIEKPFTEADRIHSFTFTAQVVKSLYIDKPALKLKEEQLFIYMPHHCDLLLPENQQHIKLSILHVLRLEAKRILPAKTASFAQLHGLHFQEIRINSSKGRWGSCSAQKNINYSFFLMLLPERLINYVVLHELAHTVEMNHSEKFWTLLDQFCNGKARQLSREIKTFRLEWYEYLVQD